MTSPLFVGPDGILVTGTHNAMTFGPSTQRQKLLVNSPDSLTDCYGGSSQSREEQVFATRYTKTGAIKWSRGVFGCWNTWPAAGVMNNNGQSLIFGNNSSEEVLFGSGETGTNLGEEEWTLSGSFVVRLTPGQ